MALDACTGGCCMCGVEAALERSRSTLSHWDTEPAWVVRMTSRVVRCGICYVNDGSIKS